MSRWRFLDTGPATAAENMAKDEELLRHAAQGDGLPVLRLYTWSPAAVSIGRFQKAECSVNRDACKRHGIDIVRRITGGRAVLHKDELTYSIVAPIKQRTFPNDVLGTYKVIASGLLAGLRELGIPAEMVSRPAPSSAASKSGQHGPACFNSPSWYEIVVQGRKIVGSAQRRVGGAFLQHGSILIGYDAALDGEVIPGGGLTESVTSICRECSRPVALDEIKEAFIRGFEKELQVSFH